MILNEMRDMSCGLKEKVQLRQELFYSVRKLDVLQELIEDESVTEIMVNRLRRGICGAGRPSQPLEQSLHLPGEAGRCHPADCGKVQPGGK